MEQEKKRRGRKASHTAETPSEDTVKVRSLRLSDDTVEELNAAKKALDARTMDEAMQVILDTFSMSAAKDAIPERATEIGEFEVLCRRLVDAYPHPLPRRRGTGSGGHQDQDGRLEQHDFPAHPYADPERPENP